MTTGDGNESDAIKLDRDSKGRFIDLTANDTAFNPTIDDSLALDGGFPKEQRLPYEPKGALIRQIYQESCVASSSRMILSDGGLARPEAYVRAVADVDCEEGGYLSNIPKALSILGLTTAYRYEAGLTLEQLEAAVAHEKSGIVSINSPVGRRPHAIVVDGITDGMVLIRDPLGEAYKVTIEDFLCLWNGKSVIATS
jgi:hypothetical protein